MAKGVLFTRYIVYILDTLIRANEIRIKCIYQHIMGYCFLLIINIKSISYLLPLLTNQFIVIYEIRICNRIANDTVTKQSPNGANLTICIRTSTLHFCNYENNRILTWDRHIYINAGLNKFV